MCLPPACFETGVRPRLRGRLLNLVVKEFSKNPNIDEVEMLKDLCLLGSNNYSTKNVTKFTHFPVLTVPMCRKN